MLKQLKVLLISPYSAQKVGGIGTWTKNLIDYIELNKSPIELKFQNTAFCVKSNLQNRIYKRFFWGIVDSIWIIIKTFINLIIFKPHTVHYTSSASIALFKDYTIGILCAIFNVNYVVHFRFGRIPDLAENMNWEWRWIMRVSNIASAVIVIDNKSYEIMKGTKYGKKIYIIPNPVSSEVYALARNNQRYNDRKFDTVVFAGHLIKAKGVYELVEACVEIPDIKQLIMCGPYLDDVKDDLIKIARKRDQGQWLVFKGEIARENVILELKKSMVFCLPSYTEGFPNAVMEAMAMSCAVVATDVGALPEMLDIETLHPAGLIVSVKNVPDLCKSLDLLFKDVNLAITLGLSGNLKILNEYNLDVIYPQYFKIWNL